MIEYEETIVSEELQKPYFNHGIAAASEWLTDNVHEVTGCITSRD